MSSVIPRKHAESVVKEKPSWRGETASSRGEEALTTPGDEERELVKLDRDERWQGYWRRALSLFGGRVSELHFLEAKERYHSLLALTDYHHDLIAQNHGADDDKAIAIAKCKETLERTADLLTRRQEHLNSLWRALTRVRILLFDKVFEPELVANQLDFCREESYRLDVENDPVVKDMLQKLAEATDDKGKNQRQIKRTVRALTERFNTIRTRRIYDQYVKMRTYRVAFWLLMLMSLILVANASLLVEKDPAIVGIPDYSPIASVRNIPEGERGLLEDISQFVVYQGEFLNKWISDNVLAFVFVAGLIGGMFSVVMRVKDRKRVAGEDAYFRYYVLTKPFVGALGAVIVFILFQSGFVQLDLLSSQLGVNPDAKIFGFAFLSGFSERFVFPDFQ
jgi:hypothetical protein